METNKVELKQNQKIQEVVAYLEGLLNGFKNGKIVIEQGDSFVCLEPADQVAVEVSAKKKKDKEKFSLELSWYAASVNCNEPLTITCNMPADKLKTGRSKPSDTKTPDRRIKSKVKAPKAKTAKGKPVKKGSTRTSKPVVKKAVNQKAKPSI